MVPPALPASITVGIGFAVARLLRKKIFCISPQRINVCGRVNFLCFDKTGTLTEDKLEIHSICPISEEGVIHEMMSMEELEKKSSESYLQCLLASCHSLRKVDDQLMGDPLEIEMMNYCKWVDF